jgi:hypothetical protein
MPAAESLPPRRTSAPLTGEMAKALDDQLARVVELQVRAWQVIGVFWALASIASKVVVDDGTTDATLVGVAIVAWFTFERRVLARRGRGVRVVLVVHRLIEHTAPWATLAWFATERGPAEALASWGPPLMYASVLALTTLHLRPVWPLLAGAGAAAQYLAVHALLIGSGRALAERQVFERATTLLLAGVLFALVAYVLRRAFGGATRVARARDLFGKYRLEREIASGGFGVVHYATYCPEGGFARPAAVKKVHPHLAREPRFVEAFRAEAELGARLVHHNIVQVLDFGRVDDAYYLAMEYVDGCTLREIMMRARGAGVPVPASLTVLVVDDVLAALQFAHAEARDVDGALLRVVHRDLAPQNVLVSRAGLVKLTDFGIARALREHAQHVTSVVGHAAYMSPEQVAGHAIDERADLFCAGIIAWELVCGRPLFARSSAAATYDAIARGGPAPLPSTIDAALAPFDGFCAKALARDPAARFASAAQMARALSAVADVVGKADAPALGRFAAGLPARGADLHEAPTLLDPTGATPSAAATLLDAPRGSS